MAGVTDLIIASTDPVNAALLIGIWRYMRSTKEDLKEDIRAMRDRMETVESAAIKPLGDD